MTPAYQRDAYKTLLETEVLHTGEDDGRPWAVARDTIFYPEGGGQPADHGELGTARVVDVQRVGGEIRHLLSSPVSPGPAVMRLDWARRYDHMQQHTAQHLLTAVAERECGWSTTAFHLGPVHSDIELAVPQLNASNLGRLEELVADEVRAAHRVRAREVAAEELAALRVRSRGLPEDHRGAVRLVEIGKVDCNTCGGTHLRSTAEIGTVCLLGTEQLRGGTRVFFVAGDRVRWRMAVHEARNLRLRSLLGAPDDELVAVVELRLGKEKELLRENRRLSSELAAATATALAVDADAVVARHWEQADMTFLQIVAKSFQTAAPHKVALLTGGHAEVAVFVLVAGTAVAGELQPLGNAVCELLDGRGGGSGGIFQGKVAAVDRRDEALAWLRSRLVG